MKQFLTHIFIFLCTSSSIAQLVGGYTINLGIGASANNYHTFTSAVSDMVNGTRMDGGPVQGPNIGGAVTFNIFDGNYIEQVSIPEIIGASVNNPITFQSNSGNNIDVTLEFTGNITNNYVVELDGADYIKFKNITISNLSPTFSRVVVFRMSADNNVLSNNIIRGPVGGGNNTSTNEALIYSSASKNSGDSIIDNHVLNGNYGIYFQAIAADKTPGLLIQGNTFENFHYRGIFLVYFDNPRIISNNVHTASTLNSSGGISLSTFTGAQIQKNIVYGLNSFGILVSNVDGTLGNEIQFYNNMIHTGGVFVNSLNGLFIHNCDYLDSYHNTINTINNTANSNRAVWILGSTNLRFQNNILMAEGINAYSIEVTGINPFLGSGFSNNNNFYNIGGNLARWLGTDAASLVALQALNGQDNNSVSVMPMFASPTDLHLLSIQPELMSPVLLPVVPDDIDFEVRNTPIMGADEIPAIILPIELYAFTGKKQKRYNLLEWITASENNNDYFILESSLNGLDFTPIAKIDGAGNSVNQIHYSYVDSTFYSRVTYYRLRQTDFDGEYEYSEVLAINILPDFRIKIYPNPTSNYFNIVHYSNISLDFNVKIYSQIGVKVFEQQINDAAPWLQHKMNIQDLEPGVYYIQIYNRDEIHWVEKIIKK